MAWADSRIFVSTILDYLNRTASFAMDLNSDSFKVALYGTSITPDNDVASASTAYNTGQWVTGGELTNSSNWPAGGIALTSVTSTSSTDAIVFDAADTPSTTSATTLSGVFGCLVYDDTLTTPVAKQGFSYNYFGGSNSVTSGLFTVVWSANGIGKLTF
jgi:hypothetical protein